MVSSNPATATASCWLYSVEQGRACPVSKSKHTDRPHPHPAPERGAREPEAVVYVALG